MIPSSVGPSTLPFSSPHRSRPFASIKSLHVSSPSSSAVHVSYSALPITDNHHHSFEVLGGARDRFLPALPFLSLPYNPFPFIAWNHHVETIFAAFFRSVPDVRFRRECLTTHDGGVVALDWVAGDERKLPVDSPVLILLPGLTGNSGDSYVRHMLCRAQNKGWRVVVLNSRGCADTPVTTPKLYSAAYVGDMHEVVSHVTARYPKANVYAVGWSIGGNILIKYLGLESKTCPLSGAVSLCNPFNLVVADEDFRKGFNIVYDKALTMAICKMLNRNALLFEDLGGEYNIPLAANAKSLREFDDGLTRVSFGFKSVDEYYSNSCSSDAVRHVQTPLLCIQAANDPLAPSRGIPREDIKKNPNCLLIVTPKGGHLGWVAGDEAPRGAPWTDTLVMDFLQFLEKEAVESPKTYNNSGGTEALHHLEV